MAYRVARMANGVIAEIYTKPQSVSLPDGRVLAFRHIETWVRQGDQMATRYGLVAVTTPPPPSYNKLTQVLRLIEVQVGAGSPVDAWQVINRPSDESLNEFTERVKDRAWDLWGRGSWTRARTAWLDYRDALKTHGVSMVQAFNQGKTVDVDTGAIDGAGAWPV